MPIKVIKKDSNLNQDNDSKLNQTSEPVNSNSTADAPKTKNLEKSAERNITKWISELREKKEVEFLHSRSFLQGLKPAI